MTEQSDLVRFEELRPHLRAVAYRMLGSLADADDAVQETWIRYSRADTTDVENLGGWLTTVTARVCLNLLSARERRSEVPMEGRLPDPVIEGEDGVEPEREALLGDAVGLALMVVLEALSPAERVAFVLHDMFGVPFDEIAELTGRSEAAARQLASRARRRVRDASAQPDPDRARQRQVVDAFFGAARRGDLEALVATLDPDAVLQSDRGPSERVAVRGAAAIAGRAVMFAAPTLEVRPAVINGAAGVLISRDGVVVTVMAFTVVNDRIVRIDSLGDPERLAAITGA